MAESVREDDVEFTVEIADGWTTIEIVGDRDAAVVVESESGERIYLPPEDFRRSADRGDQDSPYQSAREDSPYQSARDDSPYQSARQRRPREGMTPTAAGFVIRHPEPVTDLRLLR